MKKKGIIGIIIAGFVAVGAVSGGIAGTQNNDSIELTTSSANISSFNTESRASSTSSVKESANESKTSSTFSIQEITSESPKQKVQNQTTEQKQTASKSIQQVEKQQNKSNSTNQTVTPPSNSPVVYVTPTGKKYHYNSNCNGGSYSPSTLEQAQAIGLKPCEKCVR